MFFFFFPADCFVFGLSSQGARWQCLQVARPLEQSRCPPYHTSDMSESHSIVSAPLKHIPGARTKWQCCSLCCTKHSLVCPCCYWVCQHHPWAHLILWSGIVTTLPGLACSRARAKGVSNSLVSGLIALLAFDHLCCWRYNCDDGLPQLPYNSPASLFSMVIVQWYVPSPCKHCM